MKNSSSLSTEGKTKLQRHNTESLDLVNHSYNKNNVRVGDPVYVSAYKNYPAVVRGLKLDSKNKKIFAYLKTFSEGLPSRVDVSDCRKRENNI